MTKTTISLAIALALGMGTGLGYWLAAGAQEAAAAMPAKAERKVLYWYDPMKPAQHFDQPGKSPFMDMDLVPRYADEGGATAADAGVRIEARLVQNLGVRWGTVEKGSLPGGTQASGSLVFNDRDVAIVQARTGGIVESVPPRAVGDVIAAGAPLATVRMPEWLAAQNEYLALKGDAVLREAAGSRMRQLGMNEAQIARLDQSGVASAVLTITSPRSGMLAELNVRQGMQLAAGQTLARVNGLATIWVEAQVPEAQLAGIKVGTPVSVTLAAIPGETFKARVTQLVPELDKETRTVRIRAELLNRDGRLRPGMYASIDLHSSNSNVYSLIPTDALISTGKRQVVLLDAGQGRFMPQEVKAGRSRDGKTEILQGLQAGQRIVLSGQFLIDSEASLQGVLARMAAVASQPATQDGHAGMDHGDHDSMKRPQDGGTDKPGHAGMDTSEHAGHDMAVPAAKVAAEKAEAKTASPTQPTVAGVEGRGVVRALGKGEITLAHEAIPAIQWPAMTMPIALAKPQLAAGLKVGDRIRFTLADTDTDPTIVAIRKEGQP